MSKRRERMKQSYRLLFGPLTGAVLVFGVAGLGLTVPGYSHIHQTLSEIGEIGSPARASFTVLLCCVAACILVFASAVRDLSLKLGHSSLGAYFIASMAASAAGVGIFSFPHPLHNVFGMSELIGYQAPLVLALTWRRDKQAGSLVAFSYIMFALIWIALGLNMSAMDRQGTVWAQVHPVYGIVQRALFVTWFSWCAGVGVMLFRRQRRSPVA